MERIPEYVKTGFVVGLSTVGCAVSYSFMSSYQVAPALIVASKIFLFTFPVIGTGIVIKKMYDFHTAPPAGHQRVPRND